MSLKKKDSLRTFSDLGGCAHGLTVCNPSATSNGWMVAPRRGSERASIVGKIGGFGCSPAFILLLNLTSGACLITARSVRSTPGGATKRSSTSGISAAIFCTNALPSVLDLVCKCTYSECDGSIPFEFWISFVNTGSLEPSGNHCFRLGC